MKQGMGGEVPILDEVIRGRPLGGGDSWGETWKLHLELESHSTVCCAPQTHLEWMFFVTDELQGAFGYALWCVPCELGLFWGCLRCWSLVFLSDTELGVWDPIVQGAGMSVREPLRLSEPQLDSGELCPFPCPNLDWRCSHFPGIRLWVNTHCGPSPCLSTVDSTGEAEARVPALKILAVWLGKLKHTSDKRWYDPDPKSHWCSGKGEAADAG